jgi:hypothetical protein
MYKDKGAALGWLGLPFQGVDLAELFLKLTEFS